MPFLNNNQYNPIFSDEDSTGNEKSDETRVSEDYDSEIESMDKTYEGLLSRRTTPRMVSQILAIVNVVLFFVMLGISITVLRSSTSCSLEGPEPPYSKLRVDGAVKIVNKRFKPQKIFQSEPSDEVDRAWNETMEFDNAVGMSLEDVKLHGLPRSIQSARSPDLHIYGVSVFHQLHCLDILRKSAYPERYMRGQSTEKIQFHRNHCLDFLRQVILCKADVSMIYWWNTNYTTVEPDGTTRDSDYYLSLTPEQREKQSFVKWDVEHQCHDVDAVIKWLDKNRIDRYWQ